jgi:cell division protein FtsB
MKQFKSRRKAKQVMYSPIAVILLIVIVAILARGVWSIYEKYHLSVGRLAQSESQLADIDSRESQLSSSISELSTASGTEAALRSNFRVVKPGESLAVIIDTAPTSSLATTSTEGSWLRLSAWFSDLF